MIKRDGVELMNARTKNVSIGKDTVDIVKNKRYKSSSGKDVDLSQSLDNAINGTVYYPDDESIVLKEVKPINYFFEVVNEKTDIAAQRLLKQGKTNIVALNFASARNQGGGFLAGAIAQEEDLCRASGLYSCLKKKPMFYNKNIMCDNTFYTDGIIYSPKVPFFRNEDGSLIDEPYELSIISAPAPNVNSLKRPSIEDDPNDDFGACLYATLLKRAKKILTVVALNGHKNIILGAWGCGAFGNDPGQVASVFNEALQQVPVFEYVCFAVYDTREPLALYNTFKYVFK